MLSPGGGPQDVPADPDVPTLAQAFPALAHQRVAAQERRITEQEVVRVVDSVLLPTLGLAPSRPCGSSPHLIT